MAREIAEKLGYTSGISYSEIASTASEYGRKKLAIKVLVRTFYTVDFLSVIIFQLLDYESKASEQVKLLLDLGENTPALIKAIESGDTDLVYTVILKLREKMPLGDFKVNLLITFTMFVYVSVCNFR